MAVVDLTLAPQETRLIDATLACVARWGATKTTLDDVAREAGCSRATVYRVFPGGKDSLLEATVRAEVSRFLSALTAALDEQESLEDRVVVGINAAARELAGHDALQFLLAHEPEVILPLVAFSRMDRVFAVVREVLTPYLAPYVGRAEAPRAAEWLARLTVSYVLCPSDAYDLTDERSVRDLVRAYVLPGLETPVPTKAGRSA